MDSDESVDMIIGKCQSEPSKIRVAANGRIVIPAMVREELGIKDGDELLLTREGCTIRICTFAQAVRRAQERVAKYVRPGAVVDEFIKEREDEAKEEQRELDEWYGSRRSGR